MTFSHKDGDIFAISWAMLLSSSSRVAGLWVYTFCFKKPHKKNPGASDRKTVAAMRCWRDARWRAHRTYRRLAPRFSMLCGTGLRPVGTRCCPGPNHTIPALSCVDIALHWQIRYKNIFIANFDQKPHETVVRCEWRGCSCTEWGWSLAQIRQKLIHQRSQSHLRRSTVFSVHGAMLPQT